MPRSTAPESGTPENALSRRTLLRSLGAGGAALAAPALLSACSTTSSGGSVSNSGAKAAPWPTYLPRTIVTPDLAPTADGVQAGYLSYPSKLVKAVDRRPGSGKDKIRVITITYGTPPKPVGHNRFWQAVQKALGVEVEFTVVPEADFQAKMATVFAGGDLPDVISLGGGFVLPREAEFVKAKCADLTEFLSGDAAKAYPNLAGIPTYAWQGVGRIAGRIHGIPLERPKTSDALFLDQEAFRRAGFHQGMPKAEFAAMAKRASDSRHWAIGAYSGSAFSYPVHAVWHGTANEWRLGGGKAVDMWGAPEFKEALDFMSGLRRDGSYNPDATSLSDVDMMTQFYNGTIKSMIDGFLAYPTNYQGIKGAFTLDLAQPYAVSGHRPQYQATRGAFGYVVLKQAPKERVEMILRVLDFLAAPFGSEEYELSHYGVEGVHFTRNKNNDPIATELGLVESNTNVPFKYVCDAPQVLYQPGGPDLVKRIHDWQRTVVPMLVTNDRWGLQSDLFSRKGASLNQILADGVTAVVAGRKKVSDWDAVYKRWQNEGGSRLADELLKEYEAAH
ncbi:extracellular solute-binding protein [Actinacidiphila alni]|uniref:extracellular solute-binding protein n=1 Tax=Actinacidiphila alni TaxID=380248 RepID=UPI003453CD25